MSVLKTDNIFTPNYQQFLAAEIAQIAYLSNDNSNNCNTLISSTTAISNIVKDENLSISTNDNTDKNKDDSSEENVHTNNTTIFNMGNTVRKDGDSHINREFNKMTIDSIPNTTANTVITSTTSIITNTNTDTASSSELEELS